MLYITKTNRRLIARFISDLRLGARPCPAARVTPSEFSNRGFILGVLVRAGPMCSSSWEFRTSLYVVSVLSQGRKCVPLFAMVAHGSSCGAVSIPVVHGRSKALLRPPSFLAYLFRACVSCLISGALSTGSFGLSLWCFFARLSCCHWGQS